MAFTGNIVATLTLNSVDARNTGMTSAELPCVDDDVAKFINGTIKYTKGATSDSNLMLKSFKLVFNDTYNVSFGVIDTPALSSKNIIIYSIIYQSKYSSQRQQIADIVKTLSDAKTGNIKVEISEVLFVENTSALTPYYSYNLINATTSICPVIISNNSNTTYTKIVDQGGDLEVSQSTISFAYTNSSVTFSRSYSSSSNFSVTSQYDRSVGLHYADITVVDGSLFVGNTFSLQYYQADNYSLVVNPAYIYTQQSPLYVDTNGATLDYESLGLTYEVRNTNSQLVGSATNVSINNTITYQQAVDGNGAVVKTATGQFVLNVTELSASKTYDVTGGNLTIYCQPLKVVSLEITGQDSQIYYRGRTNTFKIPTGLTIKAVRNNGSKYVTLDVNYRTSNSQSGTNLSVGDPIQSSQDVIFVVFNNSIFGSYEIHYVTDTISSISCSQVSPIVYGDYLKNEYFQLTATFASGNAEILSDYEITSPTTMILDNTIQSFQIRVYGQTSTVNLSNPSFSIPSISSIDIGEYVEVYNNGLEKIDLTNTNVVIHYSGVPYTNTATLGLTPTNSNYGVVAYKSLNTNLFPSETIDNYNGTNTVNISTLTSGTQNCFFDFTVKNYFSDSTYYSFKTFSVIAMTEIVGIKVVDPYTQYRVGDYFLGENDTTKIAIYWKENDQNETLNSKVINLNSGYSSIAIYPQIGTQFKNVDSSKEIRIKSITNSSVSAEYVIQVLPKNVSSDTRIHDLVTVWRSNVVLPDGTVHQPQNGVLLIVDVNDTTVDVNGIRTITNQNYTAYGYIDNILDEYISAKVVMFNDYMPEISGSSNIEITYPCYTEGEADIINNCKFGCLFGANNSVNRLFVSGNEKIVNADWHTAELNLTDYEGEIEKENGNFSYIPSVSVMYYGETDNAVIGYEIVSNDKLLVLKTKSDKEKTVYFRTPITVKSIDSSGSISTDQEGNALYEEEFGLVKGNNSVAGINPRSIVNLNGDLLFIDSDNQISGLDLVGIIGDNQRYANSRSKYIDLRLKNLNLNDAILWTNNKYLFMSIDDVGLFVTRFDAISNNQYEWWFLTSDNPKSFIEIDNVIYFGNDEGKLVKLFNNEYNDIKKIFVGTRDNLYVQFSPLEEKLTINQSLYNKIDKSGDKSYLFNAIDNDEDYEANLYTQIATMKHSPSTCDLLLASSGNIVEVKNSDVTIVEGKNYYLNYIESEITEQSNRNMNCVAGSEFDNFTTTYRFHLVTDDDVSYSPLKRRYRLYKVQDGIETPVSNLANLTKASLCERVKKAVLTDFDDQNYSFKLKIDNKYIDIVTFGHQDPRNEHIKADIDEISEVEAYYITAPMFASNMNTFKTIWQITLSNDTFIPSALEVAIASNKIPTFDTKTIAKVSKGGLGTDYGDYDYLKVDYDKLVVPRTYTITKTLGMQKFVCFAFKNEKGNNAVLSEMAITYTLPFPSYGSD